MNRGKNEQKYKNNYWFGSGNLYNYGHFKFDWI